MLRALGVEPVLEARANRARAEFAKLQLCTFAKLALFRVVIDAIDLADQIERFLRDGRGFKRLEELAPDMR